MTFAPGASFFTVASSCRESLVARGDLASRNHELGRQRRLAGRIRQQGPALDAHVVQREGEGQLGIGEQPGSRGRGACHRRAVRHACEMAGVHLQPAYLEPADLQPPVEQKGREGEIRVEPADLDDDVPLLDLRLLEHDAGEARRDFGHVELESGHAARGAEQRPALDGRKQREPAQDTAEHQQNAEENEQPAGKLHAQGEDTGMVAKLPASAKKKGRPKAAVFFSWATRRELPAGDSATVSWRRFVSPASRLPSHPQEGGQTA
ncbi:MAG: hypothetical protein WDM96_11865 [Lacunisphaera sp.]